jgi:uncharacterized membrane protein
MKDKNSNKLEHEINYLKQWLFISVLGLFGISGWIFTYIEIEFKIYFAILGLFVFLFSVIVFHRKISKKYKKWK